MGQNNMAKSIVNFILFIIFIDIKFVMVSILIVSRCKYKDYFRFYKVYFHIFIVAVRGWLIHTQHETKLYILMYARAHTRTRLVNFSTTDHQLRITTYHIASYNGGQKIFKWVIDHQSTTHQYPWLPIQSPLQHHSLLLDNNRDSTFYDRPYCSLCLYNITQHLAKRWKTPLPNVRKYFYQRWKTLLSTLDNTFIKRWIILLSNVG